MTSTKISKVAARLSKIKSSSVLSDEDFLYLSSIQKRQFFYSYFKGREVNNYLEHIGSSLYPLEFIQGIRTSQVYLQDPVLKRLLKLQFPKNFSLHVELWQELQSKNSELYFKIDSLFLQLPNETSIVLAQLIIWLENQRFNQNNSETLNDLSRVYQFFILQYLSFESNPKIIEDEFIKSFVEELLVEKSTNPTSQILDTIQEWVKFKDIWINEYSFDLEIQPIRNNGKIELKAPKDLVESWKNEQRFYDITSEIYEQIAEEEVKFLESNGNLIIPSGRFLEDKGINRKLEIQKRKTTLILEDLAINNFHFRKKPIEVSSLLQPLLGYSTNRFFRYEMLIKKNKLDNKSFKETFLITLRESSKKGLSIEPYILISIQDYLTLLNDVYKDYPIEIKEEIIALFSFKVSSNFKFDRLRKAYNVWTKPFIQIGDLLFCPMLFFANNDWFYAFAQAAIENLNHPSNRGFQKDNSKKIETKLTEEFAAIGFKATNLPDSDKYKGDVDILVEDDSSVLFIQLKRTYFRLDLESQYNEELNSEIHAMNQLNEAEKSLSKPNEIYHFKKKPIKWIVSTSLENIGKTFDGCLKVNYFDLFRILRTKEQKTIQGIYDNLMPTVIPT